MPKEKKQPPGWSAYNYSRLSNAYVANELQQIIKVHNRKHFNIIT